MQDQDLKLLMEVSVRPDISEVKDMIQHLLDSFESEEMLSANQIKALHTLNSNRKAFVEVAIEAAERHPDLLPSSFAVKEFRESYELSLMLEDILESVKKLAQIIKQDGFLAGHHAFKDALVLFNYLKAMSLYDDNAEDYHQRLLECGCFKGGKSK